MIRPRDIVIATALVTVIGCRPSGPDESVELSRCWLDGLSVEARCGTIEVYEDRERDEGRRIELRFAVVPVTRRDPRPDPLFMLAGGPGFAATQTAAPIADILSEVRRKRDIVLVDQRGTGDSNPLDCSPDDEDEDEIGPMDLFPGEKLERCLENLDADPALYTTPLAMDDLDDVRAALGYDRINLWGGSYGTRAALVYLRRHPERTRSVVLDGVHLLDNKHPLHSPVNMQGAFDSMLERCSADQACSDAFPNLSARLDELLEQLAEKITVELPHPRTGRVEEVEIGRDDFAVTLSHLLYYPQFVSLMPQTIVQAAEGDFAPFFAQAMAFSGGGDVKLYEGKQLSVACAEDVERISEEEVERLSSGTLVGDVITRAFIDACSIWPRGEVPEGYHDPIVSDAPVLILSGEMDPVTPPSYGEEAASTLSRSLHLVVPGAGHGVTVVGCVPDIIAEFLEEGRAEELDFSCASDIEPPAFFQDLAGPPT